MPELCPGMIFFGPACRIIITVRMNDMATMTTLMTATTPANSFTAAPARETGALLLLGRGTAVQVVNQPVTGTTGIRAAGPVRRWKASDIRPPQRWGINE
jgi:hypothetical protein